MYVRLFQRYGMDYEETPQPFFRGVITDSDGANSAWFASTSINNCVIEEEINMLHLDGTFFVTPKIGQQLFIMSVQKNGMVIFLLDYFKYFNKKFKF